MTIALFIGRFQPFHKGHLWAVQEILKDNSKVIIGIGSSQESGTAINPFSARERRDIIISALTEEKIKSYVIFDIPDTTDDCDWVTHVTKILPHFDVVYTGSPLSRQLFQEDGYIVKKMPRHNNISASEIRLRIMKRLEWKSLVPVSVAIVLEQIGAEKRISSELS